MTLPDSIFWSLRDYDAGLKPPSDPLCKDLNLKVISHGMHGLCDGGTPKNTHMVLVDGSVFMFVHSIDASLFH